MKSCPDGGKSGPFSRTGPTRHRISDSASPSGINTPWRRKARGTGLGMEKAGIELSAELNPPAIQLDWWPSLKRGPGAMRKRPASRAPEPDPRNNISLERQKRSTVSNEIRSAVYLVTMLKDCLIGGKSSARSCRTSRTRKADHGGPAQNESRRSQPVQAGPCWPRQGA